MCGNEINVMCNVNVPGNDQKPYQEKFLSQKYNLCILDYKEKGA